MYCYSCALKMHMLMLWQDNFADLMNFCFHRMTVDASLYNELLRLYNSFCGIWEFFLLSDLLFRCADLMLHISSKFCCWREISLSSRRNSSWIHRSCTMDVSYPVHNTNSQASPVLPFSAQKALFFLFRLIALHWHLLVLGCYDLV